MQVKLLRTKFVEALGDEGRHLVDVNTIDGFQVTHSACCAHPNLSTSLQFHHVLCAVLKKRTFSAVFAEDGRREPTSNDGFMCRGGRRT